MQTVQLNIMIVAPVERCYRLALSAELARDAMDGWRSERESEDRQTLAVGDVLRWGAQRRVRSMGAFSETIKELRPRTLVRRTFAGPRFGWGESQQTFAPMNQGTWIHEEYRFAAPAGLLCSLRERRLERQITVMARERGWFLKSVAEGSGWPHYLPASERDVKRGA